MNKLHCNLCDDVIAKTERRVTLLVGIARGDRSIDAQVPDDYCLSCARRRGADILRQLLADTADWKVERVTPIR